MPNLIPDFELNYDYLSKLHIHKTYSILQPTSIKPRRFENIEVSSDNLVFRLRDKKQADVVSIVVFEIKRYFNKDFHEIQFTWSKYPKRHHLSYLFEMILKEYNIEILSDSRQTSPGSKEFWLAMGRQKEYNLMIYNTKTNYYREYNNYPISKIWGIDTDIEDNELKLYFIEDMYERRQISSAIYTFLTENVQDIKDRAHVRLLLRSE